MFRVVSKSARAFVGAIVITSTNLNPKKWCRYSLTLATDHVAIHTSVTVAIIFAALAEATPRFNILAHPHRRDSAAPRRFPWPHWGKIVLWSIS